MESESATALLVPVGHAGGYQSLPRLMNMSIIVSSPTSRLQFYYLQFIGAALFVMQRVLLGCRSSVSLLLQCL